MKTGLVLEGGGMRGMYTAGVLDTFMENDIKTDLVVGVSAGALFGVNFLSGQKGRAIRYNKRFNGDKNYMGIRPLLKEGNIVSTEYAYGKVPRELDVFDDETYQKSGIPFYAVITSMETGKAEYVKIDSVFRQMDTLRASGSMPFVSRLVEVEGKMYLDGGVSDSIPYGFAAEQGCDKLIVVVTRDKSYRKKPGGKLLAKLAYGKYPNFLKCLLGRYKMYNSQAETLMQWEKDGKAFVIRPSYPIEMGRMEKDPEKLQQVYDMGVKDCLARLEELKRYLG